MMKGRRSTPAGGHRPVLLDEVLQALAVSPGAVVVDATVGAGGHAAELLRKAGPEGKLIGLDRDPEHLEQARARLTAVGFPFALHHANFAGLPAVLAAEGIEAVDAVLADLGMSSMQVDDAERGFSYMRDGPLDMRMDRTRGRSAADILATIDQEELAAALLELGDEPQPDRIAAAIIAARGQQPLTRTAQLAQVIRDAAGKQHWQLRPAPGRWEIHPAARTFQALRLLVNRELPVLEQLLRTLPYCVKPGGRIAIISFHSGEDRRVKAAFRSGLKDGTYSAISEEPQRASFAERGENPRSRSAKLRWARKGT